MRSLSKDQLDLYACALSELILAIAGLYGSAFCAVTDRISGHASGVFGAFQGAHSFGVAFTEFMGQCVGASTKSGEFLSHHLAVYCT